MEVEVEGAARAEGAVQAAQGVVPALGEGVEQAGVAAAGVLGEGGALGDGVEAGEQGDAVVERGLQDGGLLLGGAAGELGQAGLAQDLVDEADAVGEVFEAKAGGDVVDGEVVLAQGEDALAGAGGGVGGGAGGSGSGPAGGEEEVGIVGAEELGAEIAEAAGGVAEVAGGCGGGGAVDEAGAEGFVTALAGGGRLEEAVGETRYLPHEHNKTILQRNIRVKRKIAPRRGIWPVQAANDRNRVSYGGDQAGFEADRCRSAAGAVSPDG